MAAYLNLDLDIVQIHVAESVLDLSSKSKILELINSIQIVVRFRPSTARMGSGCAGQSYEPDPRKGGIDHELAVSPETSRKIFV